MTKHRFQARCWRVWGMVAALMMLQGCYSWHPVQVGTEPSPEVVRVNTGDERVEIMNARVAGDTLLVGDVLRRSLPGGSFIQDWGQFMAPLGDVQRVEERHFSVGKTLLTVVSIPVASLGALIVLLTVAR